MTRTITKSFVGLFAMTILLGSVLPLEAATATWDANPETNIASYILSYGSQPGQHPFSVNVGNVTTTQVTLTPGQRYYFVVQAVNTFSQTSPPSAEVIFDEPIGNRAPVLTQPANQTSAENATISLALVASDPDGNPLTYSTTGLPVTLSANPTTGLISGTLTSTSAGTYSVTATVSDSVLTNSATFTWTVTDVGPAPSITGLSPTSGAVGTAVTIAGANFGTTQGTSTVRFNGTVATPTSWNAGSIAVPVPTGATTGAVVVTVGGVASNDMTFTVPGGSAITLLQQRSVQTSAASAPLAFASPNAAGNFVAVAVRALTINQTVTVTDTRGNVYREAVKFNNGSDDTVAIYYAENIGVGANTVTVSLSTAGSLRFAIFEYSGIATSNALDGIVSATLSSATPSSGSVTTTADGDLLIGIVSSRSGRTFTAGSGYAIRETVPVPPSSRLMVEDRVQATAGPASATATLNASDVWGAGMAAFKSAGTVTNRAPMLTQPANQISTENSMISLALVASDPDGNPLTYSATALPVALSMNPATGVISGTPAFTSAGAYSVTATVSDGMLTNSKTFTWSVMDVNRAPVLTQPANQSHLEGATIALALAGSDPDGNPLTYSATALPAALSVNPTTGLITGTLTSTSAGVHSVTATVSDGTLTSSTTFTWTVTDVAAAPSITSLSPTSGAVAAVVTITGTNFGSTQGTSTVRFNGTAATPNSWNASTIVVPVPTGATTGLVVVTVGGVDSNGVSFTVVPAAGPVTLIQHRNIQNTGASVTLAFSSANVVGNFVAVVVRATNANQTLTVGDSRGNVYRQAVKFNTATPGGSTVAIYYAENVRAGSNSITVTLSSAASVRFAILEYSGIATSSALDVVASATLAGTSPNSGSATTTTNGALILGVVSTQNARTMTAGSGYAIRDTIAAPPSTFLMVEDRIQATAGPASVTATLNTSNTWGAGLAAFKNASSGAASASSMTQLVFEGLNQAAEPTQPDAPRPDDFDGDGTADITVFRPATGAWTSLTSSTNFIESKASLLGEASDIPVPGDYDGDRKADVAVFSPATGVWRILTSSTNNTGRASYTWGENGDLPVPADYDGDGLTDIAVFRPSTGIWHILKSSTDYTEGAAYAWGGSNDRPLVGDYDGDRRADLALYRASTGTWEILQSSTGYRESLRLTLGNSTDTLLPGDYDGDGKTDAAAFRPSTGTWTILTSSARFGAPVTIPWGGSGDTGVAADYDGDGRTDIAAFSATTGVWYILKSTTEYSSYMTFTRGTRGDTPLPSGR